MCSPKLCMVQALRQFDNFCQIYPNFQSRPNELRLFLKFHVFVVFLQQFILCLHHIIMQSRKIHNRIEILRRERGFSRKELAELIGVNYQTVGYLEREEYNPSLDLAFRICAVFELPIDFVFSTKPFTPLSQELLNQKK